MKEKQFVYVKKDTKERDKEVRAKTIIFASLYFIFMGITWTYSVIDKLEFTGIKLADDIISFGIFLLFVGILVCCLYILSELLTKKYKLQELKR